MSKNIKSREILNWEAQRKFIVDAAPSLKFEPNFMTPTYLFEIGKICRGFFPFGKTGEIREMRDGRTRRECEGSQEQAANIAARCDACYHVGYWSSRSIRVFFLSHSFAPFTAASTSQQTARHEFPLSLGPRRLCCRVRYPSRPSRLIIKNARTKTKTLTLTIPSSWLNFPINERFLFAGNRLREIATFSHFSDALLIKDFSNL